MPIQAQQFKKCHNLTVHAKVKIEIRTCAKIQKSTPKAIFVQTTGNETKLKPHACTINFFSDPGTKANKQRFRTLIDPSKILTAAKLVAYRGTTIFFRCGDT